MLSGLKSFAQSVIRDDKMIPKTFYSDRRKVKGKAKKKDSVGVKDINVLKSTKLFTSPFTLAARERPEEEQQKEKRDVLEYKKDPMSKEAAFFHTLELKEREIERTDDINKKIFLYVNDGSFQKFKEIFEKYKISPEIKDSNGNTPLNIAVQGNWVDIVTYLIQAGANVNTYNKMHNTPLHHAFIFKNFTMGDLLIRNGANESVINNMGLTPWQCIKLY